MKNALCLACFIAALQLNAQKNSVYYVTSVYGIVKKADGHKLIVGDSLWQPEINTLELISNASITLYSADKGSTQLPLKENGSYFFEALLDVFKSKSSRVNLSSRGDCSSMVFDDCLKTDSVINQKLLLIDSLVLPQPTIDNGTANAFFVQWKNNGKLINKILTCNSGNICIKPSDIGNKGDEFNENENVLTLGAIINSSEGKTYNKLGTMQLYCTTSSFVNTYYAGLRTAMKDRSPKEIFDRLYTELYIFYGRPDVCTLKKAIHYID